MNDTTTPQRRRHRARRALLLGAAGLTLAFGLAAVESLPQAQGDPTPPTYAVDPMWPKPLPTTTDETGVERQWITGSVGASCLDSRGHLITFNRAYESPEPPLGPLSVAAPPVIEYDADGNVVHTWGDATLLPNGGTRALPNGLHGCFVDHQDNIWVAGYRDGVVQKWSHDGSQMLLQIGEKGRCDGPETLAPDTPYPTCGSPGNNSSRTLLNNPADMYVDPEPDPQTGRPGSVYIADGYGNHRVVVFDGEGQYLRQWGSAGSGPGQFVEAGGGHPHCVVIGNDGLVYVCDRGNNRIQVFDKMGNLERIIPIEPPAYMGQRISGSAANDFAFSRDPEQELIFDTDLGSYVIWMMVRHNGNIIGRIGRPGRMAGDFILPHSIDIDADENIYVAETGTGNRVQKFVRMR